MRINTNVASLTAQEASTNTNKALSSSLEKLGSGLRINKAADDASGLAIADKLRTQASSLGQGISNANSASALIQIADKAMAEQSNILDTVKSKLIQAGTSTTNADGREAIRKDVQKLLTQFDNIAAQTNYNGTTLLQAGANDVAKQDELSFQLGEDKTFDVTIVATKASNTQGLGGGSDTIVGAAIGDGALSPVTGVSSTSGNNIAVNGSQQIKSSGTILLEDVDLAADGTEAAGGTVIMDINVSGKIGSVVSVNDIKFDASSQTSATKDALSALAVTNANFQSLGNGEYSLAGTTTVSFGDLDFSSMQVTSGAVAEGLQLNTGAVADTTIVVKDNNTGTDLPLLGQLNIAAGTAGTAITGGNLLSDLKDLASGGLTSDKANAFMTTIDEALTQMNANRSDFGSTQNQLQSSVRNMQTTQTNLKAAEAVIRDVDYAAESASFNKSNIIAQAGTYAMSQANSMAQNVQKLLQ